VEDVREVGKTASAAFVADARGALSRWKSRFPRAPSPHFDSPIRRTSRLRYACRGPCSRAHVSQPQIICNFPTGPLDAARAWACRAECGGKAASAAAGQQTSPTMSGGVGTAPIRSPQICGLRSEKFILLRRDRHRRDPRKERCGLSVMFDRG
jgi:hypothetical protein